MRLVPVHRVSRRAERRLDSREPFVDALPAGGDQVDEEPEILDAPATLCLGRALDRFEPPNHLAHQATDLGEVPADREDLLAQTLVDGVRDAPGERRGRLGRSVRESRQIRPRPFEQCVESSCVCTLLEALPTTLDCVLAHDRRL